MSGKSWGYAKTQLRCWFLPEVLWNVMGVVMFPNLHTFANINITIKILSTWLVKVLRINLLRYLYTGLLLILIYSGSPMNLRKFKNNLKIMKLFFWFKLWKLVKKILSDDIIEWRKKKIKAWHWIFSLQFLKQNESSTKPYYLLQLLCHAEATCRFYAFSILHRYYIYMSI